MPIATASSNRVNQYLVSRRSYLAAVTAWRRKCVRARYEMRDTRYACGNNPARSISGVALALGASAVLGLAGCQGSVPGEQGGGRNGLITFATGKDTTGRLQGIIDTWNRQHPGEHVVLLELPESADEQRTSMVLNFLAESP